MELYGNLKAYDALTHFQIIATAISVTAEFPRTDRRHRHLSIIVNIGAKRAKEGTGSIAVDRLRTSGASTAAGAIWETAQIASGDGLHFLL